MHKNIWIINHYAGSAKNGMELRHYNLAKVLITLGYKVSIISSSFTHLMYSPPEVNSNITYENIDNISYCWIKTPYYRNNGLQRILNMLLFSLRLLFYGDRGLKLENPDVIIASSPHPLVAFNGYRLAKKYRSKFIFEIRDLWTLTYLELNKLRKFNPLVRILLFFETFGYKKAELVISPLNNINDFFVHKDISNKKSLFIPNGILLEDFNNILNNNEYTLNYDIEELISLNKFLIGYAGALNSANSLITLIEAANLLRSYSNIHFVLIGDGPEKDMLILESNRCKLNNVLFLPKMERQKVFLYLKKMDVLYNGAPKSVLYKYGSSPIKLSEYMALSKPILNGMESPDNIVNIADCGITFKSEDSNELAKSILDLYNMSESERNKLGLNGYNYVTNNLDYKNITKRLVYGFENQ